MKTVQTATKRLLAASLAGLLFMSATPAQANNPPPTLKVDAPNRYIVKKGDTLWDISGRYLDKPWRWKEIWATNRQIKNPNLIYPGDVLIMCLIQGKTLVGIDTGDGCLGVEKAMNNNNEVVADKVEITPLGSSIPPIPLSAIQYWLDRVTIVNPKDYDTTPYVIASKNRNLITATGDKVYVKGTPLIIGQHYGIYRKGQPYVDPTTQQIIGLEVEQIANGVVTDVASNGVSSLQLLQTYDDAVKEGDHVFIGLGNDVPPVFYPTPAVVNRGGKIIRIMGTINQGAQGSVVAINLGSENGAKPGDVLTIYRRGPLVRDVQDNDNPVRLPSEQAGHLMVFKTYGKISYAYVLDSELPLAVGDQLLPPADL